MYVFLLLFGYFCILLHFFGSIFPLKVYVWNKILLSSPFCKRPSLLFPLLIRILFGLFLVHLNTKLFPLTIEGIPHFLYKKKRKKSKNPDLCNERLDHLIIAFKADNKTDFKNTLKQLFAISPHENQKWRIFFTR